MIVFFTFTIISFLNRCLNPFIYASQYDVVRRTWTPLVEFLRRHITTKPEDALAMVERAPSAQLSTAQPTRPQQPMVT